MTPLILGLGGTRLTPDERALYADAQPAGFILFARNIDTPEQVRDLTGELCGLTGRDRTLVMTDQEGGRVARFGPPHWPRFPAGEAFAALYDIAPASAIMAAQANGRALGSVLSALGITANAAPVLDLRQSDSHAVIASRCLGSEPMAVAALGKAMIEGMAQAGVAAIMKHVPGQGRAKTDSHVSLPVVDADADALEQDIAPFRALAGQAPMAMVAHILYPAWDAQRAASISPTVVGDIIRGRIGFDGLLMSDAIDMEALGGSMVERVRAVLDAGCDLALHCTGDFAEMKALCGATGPVAADSLSHQRLASAMAMTGGGAVPPLDGLLAHRDALLALA